MLGGDGEDLRHLIGMEFTQALLKGRVGMSRGFEDRQHLAAGLHHALPAVDGLHARTQIDTGRQLRIDEQCASLARAVQIRKRG